MSAPPAAADAARVPVWSALSDLYLDTDVSGHHDRIVRVLAASPYTLDELGRILFDEVHPLLRHNLLSVAGEWAGFDEAWLAERLRAARPPPRWRRRVRGWFSGGRFPGGWFSGGWFLDGPILRDVRGHWDALAPRIAAARAGAGA